MKIKPLFIVLLLVILGTGAALFFFPSQEKKVKRQFSLLSKQVSKDSGESPFIMAQKVKNIGALFDENCKLKEPVYPLSGSYSREEITSIALRGRAHFHTLSLTFYDLDLSFPDEGVARVALTARLTGKSTLGENVHEVRELVCLLKKIQKRWLFSQLEVVEVLRR